MKKRKNLTAVLAAFAMMISISGRIPAIQNTGISESLVANAATSADGMWDYNTYTNSFGKEVTTITACHSTETDIVIPAEIDGVTITNVHIYIWNTKPTSITLPSTVDTFADPAPMNSLESIAVAEDNPYYTSIDGVLYNKDATELLYVPRAKTLADFTIPEGVISIGSNAFSDCTSLTSVVIPNSVTSIGESAFLKCTGLTSVTLPNSITSIRKHAFSNCSGLTSVTIPDSVKNIGNGVFSSCSSLASISFEGELDFIGYNAFTRTPWFEAYLAENDDTYITVAGVLIAVDPALQEESEITLPEGITGIGSCVFKEFTNLTSVEIPEGVTTIGNSAFEGCSNLTSVKIPDSVATIRDAAFYQCSNLTSVKIPDSITQIGGWAFSECITLENVSMSANIQEIGIDAFHDVPWLDHEVKDNPLAIYNGILLHVNSELANRKLVIPDGVTMINHRIGANQQDSFVILASVKTISTCAFSVPSIDIYYAGSEDDWNKIQFSSPSEIDMGEKYVVSSSSITQYHVHYNYGDSEIIPTETTPAEELKQGDANGDGDVDILDVIAVNKAILGKGSLTEAQLKAVDFNGNNKPDAEESLTLLKFIVGLITEFD